MDNPSHEDSKLEWQPLKALVQAAKSVSDVYIRVDIIGGHYIRVLSEDFIETTRVMRTAAPQHPHPVRFKFTVEAGVLWVHASLNPIDNTNRAPEVS